MINIMEKKTWFSVQTEIIKRGKLKRKLSVLVFAMANRFGCGVRF